MAALPKKSIPTIVAAIVLLLVAALLAARSPSANVWIGLAAFIVSGFVGDAFTGVSHFAFDYVIPYDVPILGPIALEFNEHHDHPTLDPSDYTTNFTKGAFASLPFSVSAFLPLMLAPSSSIAFFASSLLIGLSAWALFFHQIHSYAHMGSTLPPEVFQRRIEEIRLLPTRSAQREALGALFATIPIPRPIRALQRAGLILSPENHNIHHFHFESHFSSVNGWSDAALNPFLTPIARRIRDARRVQDGPA